jgi:hypothetical protein
LALKLHDSSLHLKKPGIGCVCVSLKNVNLALQSLVLPGLRLICSLHLLLRLQLVTQNGVFGLRDAHLDNCTRGVLLRVDN